MKENSKQAQKGDNKDLLSLRTVMKDSGCLGTQ